MSRILVCVFLLHFLIIFSVQDSQKDDWEREREEATEESKQWEGKKQSGQREPLRGEMTGGDKETETEGEKKVREANLAGKEAGTLSMGKTKPSSRASLLKVCREVHSPWKTRHLFGLPQMPSSGP